MSEDTNCTGNKIRGGIILDPSNWGPAGGAFEILSGNFDISFECICGTSTIIPLPISLVRSSVLNFFRSKLPRWILEWCKVGRYSLYRMASDRARKILAPKISLVKARYDDIILKYVVLLNERKSLLKQLSQLEGAKESAEKLKAAANSLLKRLNCSQYGTANDWVSYIKSGKAPPGMTGVRNFIDCWAAATDALFYRKQLDDILSQTGNLNKEILKVTQRAKEAGSRFRELDKELYDLRQRDFYLGLAPSVSDIDSMLNSIPPEIQSGFLDDFANGFFWILEILSIVQRKNCMSNQSGLPDGLVGASLNEDTCECSECPSPKKLCDLSSWIKYVLPNTPGSRMSDELNVCIDCCEGATAKPRWYTGGLIGSIVQEFGIPPCTCECPKDIDGKPMEWADCNSEDACDRGIKKICKSKYPPDNLYGKIPNFESSYEWNAEQCKWISISSSSSSSSSSSISSDEPCDNCDEGYECCSEYWYIGYIPDEEKICRPAPCLCPGDCGWAFSDPEVGWYFSAGCTGGEGVLGSCGCPPEVADWEPPTDTVWSGTPIYGPYADCGLIQDGESVDPPDPLQ